MGKKRNKLVNDDRSAFVLWFVFAIIIWLVSILSNIYYFNTPRTSGLTMMIGTNMYALAMLVIYLLFVWYSYMTIRRMILECFNSNSSYKYSLRVLVESFIILIVLFALLYSYLSFSNSFIIELDESNFEYSMEVTDPFYKKPDVFDTTFNWVIRTTINSRKQVDLFSISGLSEDVIDTKTLNNKTQFILKPFNLFMLFMDSIYYSVATITTVGYGDIYPIGIISKFLTSIQLIVGQIIIIIGIGLAISKRGIMKE